MIEFWKAVQDTDFDKDKVYKLESYVRSEPVRQIVEIYALVIL